jgi:nucleotide-binding universal stress UspA family protein
MSKTREAEQEGTYASPTAAAPVLIGFDGAEGGRDALALGRVIASVRGSRCVVAIPHEDAAADARAALGDPGVELREIGILSPPLQLLACARREKAGTLVVGSTRRGPISRAMLGSTAKQVLHKAPCEVVVAPRDYAASPPESFARIAVAVDGTPQSKVALRRAEDLARQAGATIEILVASDPVVAGIEAEFPPGTPSSIADVLGAAVASVDPALAPVGQKVDSGWRQVARTIATALAQACEPDVDLLVAGSRRPIDRFLLGSMTNHLIAEAPCPVLVVPHAE